MTIAAVVVLTLAGALGAVRARSTSSADDVLSRARTFVAKRVTAKFRGTTSVRGGTERSPVGEAATALAQVAGELDARGRAHAVIADDGGATELVLASRAVFVRDAEGVTALAGTSYTRADVQVSRIMRLRTEQAKTFDLARVLEAATNVKTLRHNRAATTIDADVLPETLYGRELSRHVQWVTIRVVVRDTGAVDRLQVVTRAEAAVLSRIEFTQWGDNTIRIAAPAIAQVDTTPPVATVKLASFASTPLLMPKTLPAGWQLVRARVLSADDTQEGCAQVELAYEDQASGDTGFLYLYELPKSCTAAPPGDTEPFTAGSYSGFSATDEGPYVQITVGRTTVQAVSDLPRPRLAATLSELVPLALQSS